MAGPRLPLPDLPPERPDEPWRLVLARRARALRDDGALLREIGAVLGVSMSYAGELLRDPLGERTRARHERARGTCVDCGRPTSWRQADKPTTRCHACDLAERPRRRAPCGTSAAYSRGCRCTACRAAWNTYCRERFRQRYHSDQEFRERVLERGRLKAARRRAREGAA